MTAGPARPSLPPLALATPRVPPHTPLQVFFLSRLAHLVALCYYARHEVGEAFPRELLHRALGTTIDDCFAAGLAPELLALLDEAPQDD